MVAHDTSPHDVARRLVDGVVPDAAERFDARAVAWALKEECYASWSSDPGRAARAAAALAVLADSSAPRDARVAREVTALAKWTGGIAAITRGRMVEAVDAFDVADDAFRYLGRPDLAAQTQVPKIMALSMLGRNDDAIGCAERAQRAFIALGDVHAAGKVSLNLGALHVRRGAFAEAATHSRSATVFFARAGDQQHSVMADINLADALTALGDFDEATRIYARARMRADAHDFPVLAALVDESLALLHLARGRYRDALTGFEASRRQYEQMEMPQHLAIAEKQLADAYLELRLLPESLVLFDRALARFESLAMPDEQAWTLAQRGRVEALQGRPADADTSFERSATLFVGQENGIGTATVALARAELALATDDAQRAIAWGREAIAGYGAAGLVEGRLRAQSIVAFASLASGRIEAARRGFDEVLGEARAQGLLTLQIRCLTGMGLSAQAIDDSATARDAFTCAVEQFEEQRRALPWDDIRSAFLADHLRPYQELLRIALDAHASSGSDDDDATGAAVLAALDRFRARSLGEQLAQESPGADDEATSALRDRLNWLHRRARRLEDDGESAGAIVAEVRQTERELLERARRARLAAVPGEGAAGAAGAVVGPGDAPLDLAQLQAALGPRAALIAYGVLDDELFACVVTDARLVVRRRLASWKETRTALAAARFQMESLRFGDAQVERHLDTLLTRVRARMRRLHALSWAPLEDALAGVLRIVVVPHGELGSLPFAALGDTEVVGERHAITLAPSALLAMRGLVDGVAVPRTALVVAESTRLPHATVEARFVASLFPSARTLVDDEATLTALATHAKHADVLHFACHGEFRNDSPMFSALHLTDGALTAEAAQRLDLRARIVVLSACETGLAEAAHGDEMIGLVRGFLVAGAGRVLASLWPVGDRIALQFMTSFYAALRAGTAPSEALRTAQDHLRREHPHPFHWAAFVLHGGW